MRLRLKSLASRLFAHPFVQVQIKKNHSKLCVTGLSGRNTLLTGGLSLQRASCAENSSIYLHHHEFIKLHGTGYIHVIITAHCCFFRQSANAMTIAQWYKPSWNDWRWWLLPQFNFGWVWLINRYCWRDSIALFNVTPPPFTHPHTHPHTHTKIRLTRCCQ